ncbi:hypothetical protein AN963_13590 [Brevibacillus choshinensis]|uniref:Saccharopine dehydrogenase NADP binding domain-containing protein n=1 Tax=Brevibacillus choshinensis TaxID=54911 RepID=A0ABR5N6L9_BRECH|nr:saccharopine dehydrogenase NADP-binding domain-containing protein [Brevibacillus choshinensis]KQL46034.1 hypothetical protein AN963_13590 [Brevibacillus choshinensis]
MRKDFLVVGGYGHVGSTICRELSLTYPGNVIAAGRSHEKAERFCQTMGGKVRPLALDTAEPIHPSALQDVKVVVMCLDQTNTEFVQRCLQQGIHYLDISASHTFLSEVEHLHSDAKDGHATAVLSVGLAPGLTNLLAARAKREIGPLRTLDISVMLGLGDQHGKGAIEWTIDQLQTTFSVMNAGQIVPVASFTDPRKADFGKGLGKRTSYRFPFSDQQVIPHTLGVSCVSTRLCFDSSIVTLFLAILKRVGFFHLLRVEWLRESVVRLFGAIRLGKELFAIKVDANGDGGEVEYLIAGKKEAEITAKVAAWTADAIYRKDLPKGVYHMEQLFELEDVWEYIQAAYTFDHQITVNKSSIPYRNVQ